MNAGRAAVWGRRAGLVLLALVVGVLGVTALALGALRTQWGGNLVRDQAVPRVNAAIAGRLELGGFRYRGRSIELRDLVLRDPEGAVVLRAARAFVAFAPSALLSSKVQIDEITLEEPQILLQRDARGLNLTRAISPRDGAVAPKPESPEPATEPSQLVIVVERIALRGGLVTFKDLEAAGLPPIHFEAIESSGDARLALGTRELEANLALDGRTLAPVRSPLGLRVHARARNAAGQANLRFDWAGSRIDLAGRSQDATHADLTVKEIRVAPALVRAFVPTYPVLPDLVVTGEAKLRGQQVAADLGLAAADTRGRLTADAELQPPRARALKLDVKNIDVAALVKDGPRSRFDLLITGKGGGQTPETAVGDARLEIPAGGTLSGTRFGPVRVAASADRGRFTLAELLAVLPGLRLHGQGQGSMADVALDARVEARDLGLTARALGLPDARRTQGRGNLTLTVRGPTRAPELDARGHVPLLRVNDKVINELRLTAHADALGRPSRAQAQLRVASVRLGARKLDGITADLTSSQAGAFTATVALAGPTPLTVRTAGQLADSGKEVRLDRLGISYPRASWALVHPARIAFGGDLVVEGLDLRADPGQSIAAEVNLRQKAQRLEAKVAIAGLDLSRLPPLALPEGKRLEGKVDLAVRARGRVSRPEVEVALALAGGRYDRFSDLALTLAARHQQGRVTGQLTARALGAEHRARFDLPAAFPPAVAAPVDLELVVGEIDLARVLAMLEHPLRGKVVGRAGLSLTVDGKAGDPGLSLDARTRGLRVEKEALGDIVVRLRDPQGQPLTLDVDSTVYGQASQVHLTTPAVLGKWLRRPPGEEELLATPFHVRAKLGRLSLAALSARPGKAAPSLGGSVAVSADLRGPVKVLTGTLSVDAQAVSGPNVPPTDGSLRVRLGEGARGIDARLRLHRKGHVIGDLDAKVDAPVQQLMDEDAVGRAPLVVNARLGPIVLQRVGLPAQVKNSPRILRAEVQALLAIKGSLDAPTLDARLRAADGRLGNTPLGSADVTLTYARARPALKATLASANGGRLVLDGSAKVDLSLPALKKGLQPREVPVQASLTAQKFDLTFLSGLTDVVRAVSGQLDAQANLGGTVGTPQLAGKVAWRQGRLMLAGFGEFRDIDLAFRGDQKEMALERLFARSGTGDANITAKAVRQPDGQRLAIEARARLNKFRLYTEGQPMGTLSLNASAQGSVGPDRVQIDTTIPEARFELAEGDRKTLQALKRPADVVIVANGKPRDRDEARRHAELMEMQQSMIQGAAQEDAAAAARKKVAAASARKATSGGDRLLRLTVEAPRNLWIRGDDANIELGLDPDFALVSTDQARVFGTVKVRRGQVKVFGRRFEVTANSSVTFSGPPDRPRLSVDAVHRVEKGVAPITIQVHVEGPTDRLSFTLRSPERPELGDSELITVIITGRPPGDTSAGSAPGDRAASLVGGLVAGKLQKALSSRLPLDVLNIEPGQDMQGTKLEAGTYLGDDLYVAYVGRLGGDPFLRENRNELHLEYQLTPRWSFEGTYGDQRRGSADLLWTKNY